MSNVKNTTVTVGRLTITSPTDRSAEALCFNKAANAALCFRRIG